MADVGDHPLGSESSASAALEGAMTIRPRLARRCKKTVTTPSSSSSMNNDFRVQKKTNKGAAKTSWPAAAGRQSMRIAIAKSIESDRLHKLANSSHASGRTSLSSTRPKRSPASAVISNARAMMISSRPHRRVSWQSAPRGRGKKAGPVKSKEPQLDVSGGIPTGREGYYRIKGIVHEVCRAGTTQYLVEWEGVDPSTGMEWPAEWVGASDLTKSALQAWAAKKAKSEDKSTMK